MFLNLADFLWTFENGSVKTVLSIGRSIVDNLEQQDGVSTSQVFSYVVQQMVFETVMNSGESCSFSNKLIPDSLHRSGRDRPIDMKFPLVSMLREHLAVLCLNLGSFPVHFAIVIQLVDSILKQFALFSSKILPSGSVYSNMNRWCVHISIVLGLGKTKKEPEPETQDQSEERSKENTCIHTYLESFDVMLVASNFPESGCQHVGCHAGSRNNRHDGRYKSAKGSEVSCVECTGKIGVGRW